MTVPFETNAWNAVVGFPRWTGRATFGASSAAAGYPASNLGVLPLSRPWRSAGAARADTVLTAVFDRPRRVELVVLCRHTIDLGGVVTVTLYADAAMTSVLATATERAWPAVFTTAEVDWGGGRWWGRTYTGEEIAGYPWHLPVRIPGRHYAGAVRVAIDDTANAAGHVQVGLLELASEHQVPVNVEAGAQYGYASRVLAQESDGGAIAFRRRPKGRRFEGAIPYMPRDAAKGTWLEMRRQLDRDTPFFWWPNPADALHRLRDAYLARFADLSLQSYATPLGYDGVPLSLTEVI
ncbi:hypothetical protein [Roseospira visakhapatnamensis]|uniref:Acetoacetate decarboxylase n=1 Tax=Roseospira visakhapatnamensis TaxID=390880 RepID=A0A7W6RAZ3_9PROT|nr:hypothetical protein [Roseospira visakhapatnamensis]MBB4265193.1 hypothetical protein [Roseospira visakhapatnamensis]